ncbi:MAG: hotdog fold thioesterase [Desulfobacterales bacterium]|nr:hotdog fold thioesterase [Desulfobacterales bacterium]MBF0396669.1 hotdog fold thioesterase [Desulfobacterales bacterium]
MIESNIASYIKNDAFTNFLGATIEAIDTGYSRVSLEVTEAMLNFHGITHGGIIFGLGDIAFAAASNSHGQKALALNVNISFLCATKAGDHLVAEAKEVKVTGATALYDIEVMEKGSKMLIAKSQALVYRKRETFV